MGRREIAEAGPTSKTVEPKTGKEVIVGRAPKAVGDSGDVTVYE